MHIDHTTGAATAVNDRKVLIAVGEVETERDDLALYAATISDKRLKRFLNASRKCMGVGSFRTLGLAYSTW